MNYNPVSVHSNYINRQIRQIPEICLRQIDKFDKIPVQCICRNGKHSREKNQWFGKKLNQYLKKHKKLPTPKKLSCKYCFWNWLFQFYHRLSQLNYKQSNWNGMILPVISVITLNSGKLWQKSKIFPKTQEISQKTQKGPKKLK